MKKFLVAATALSGLLAIAGSARAADPVVDSGYDWSGLYIGAHAGYAFAFGDYSENLTTEDVSTSPEGFIGGGQLGYNFQSGNIVFGPEVSFTFADIDGGDFDSAVNPTVEFGNDVDWYAIIGARIGFAADRWLVYGKGGYAIADVGTSGVNAGLPDAFSDHETHDGFALGFGAEYAWTDNVLVGASYTWIDLGKEDHSGTTDAGFPYTNSDVDMEIHAIAATVSFKF